MEINFNINVNIDENITLKDLRKIGREKYNEPELWETILKIKFGIYMINGTSLDTPYFEVDMDGDVWLYLPLNVSLIKTLKTLNTCKDLEVHCGDEKYYNPKNAGVFKKYLDNHFNTKTEVDLIKLTEEKEPISKLWLGSEK